MTNLNFSNLYTVHVQWKHYKSYEVSHKKKIINNQGSQTVTMEFIYQWLLHPPGDKLPALTISIHILLKMGKISIPSLL